MARAQSTDYLHSMKFFVESASPTGAGGTNPLARTDGAGAVAGFSACTTPELTSEAVEYREGHMIYTKKYPGVPTVADITLSRGVTLRGTAFYNWMLQAVEGGEYRADLKIYHLHRDAMPGRSEGAPPTNSLGIDLENIQVARIYNIFEAFPVRHKVAGDLDATASDISVAELDVAYEHFTVEVLAPEG